ncbi:THAP domain-containing protein 9 [Trachymyrmex cornetzi]|uniref:THAP domain-containing protein 9 n=1 Tax=Trachymyrmex cornetzi TaxID=471704 RepID=A0A151IS48_9HYME|nr:THAP domain-containing protein 9 [Trachymyrmex cornetzi]
MKNKNPTAPFPASLKTFARTLHFHSPSAYEVVRNSFLKCLPCVQTLNNWICSKQYKPGISEDTINNVSSMVREEMKTGKQIIFNITFDEMHIKQHKFWDKNSHSWQGLVDHGGQLSEQGENGKKQEATKALVFMAVTINAGFKVPVAHYLINSLNDTEKGILLKDLLIKLHEKGIKVVSVTFDGDRAHKTACHSLGANLNYSDKENFKPYFDHPVTAEPVFIFCDPCHCLKLVRNYFAIKGPLIYNQNEYIHWSFIKKLNDKQQKEKLHCASKIKNRHVNFYKEKMKVCLAAQVLSNSTALALHFNEFTLNDINFAHSSATAQFCKNFNDMFDLLNVRNKTSKIPERATVTKDSLPNLKKKVEEFISYIEKLEVNVKSKTSKGENVTTRKSVIVCDSVSTGFVGFIISLQNLYNLSKYLIDNNFVDYVLSYKLSQDHVEMFFSSLRRMNGNNNNPTATQYLSAYKKVTVHKLNITIPSSANCNPLDDTELISEEVYNSAAKSSEKVLTHETKFQVSEVYQFLQQDHHVFEHSYSKPLNSDWTSSEYADEIVKYAAGSIIRMLKNKTKCSKCWDLLDGSSSSLKSKLIDLKNRGGLHFASDDVNFICMYIEKNIRSTKPFAKRYKQNVNRRNIKITPT